MESKRYNQMTLKELRDRITSRIIDPQMYLNTEQLRYWLDGTSDFYTWVISVIDEMMEDE